MLRRLFLFPLLAAFALAACQPTESNLNAEDLDSTEDEVAYIIGHDLGHALHQQMEQLTAQEDVTFDDAVILAAVRAGLRGDSLPFTPQAVDSIMRQFQDTLIARQTVRNRATTEAFLAEYAANDSVQTTESGLRYKILEPGDGPSPQLGDVVVVHYEGMLPDSTVFDSSYRRGQPARFVVGQLIPGWNEALQLMQVGARWEIVLPPDLGYGQQAPPQIGPNQTLIFEMELLDIAEGGAQ